MYTSVAEPILGISIGYADVYNRSLPGQWADLTGLPSGQYWLEVIADPYDRIQESNETNNTTRILVDLVIPDPLIHPGDYNDDGTVDAADYVVWRNTLGQTVPNYGQTNAALGTGADGDGDGIITDADYDVWRARFGETASGSFATCCRRARARLARNGLRRFLLPFLPRQVANNGIARRFSRPIRTPIRCASR